MPRRKKGPNLSAAQIAIRDFQIVKQRRELGWSWREIAEAHGLTQKAAQEAERRTLEAIPDLMNMDPVGIAENILREYLMSVRILDQMAAEYSEKNPSAAVGAVKGANDAREKVTALLQAMNRMPKELGTLRHLIDVRAISVRMLDTIDQFERRMEELGDAIPPGPRKELGAATIEVRSTWEELIGVRDAEGNAR